MNKMSIASCKIRPIRALVVAFALAVCALAASAQQTGSAFDPDTKYMIKNRYTGKSMLLKQKGQLDPILFDFGVGGVYFEQNDDNPEWYKIKSAYPEGGYLGFIGGGLNVVDETSVEFKISQNEGGGYVFYNMIHGEGSYFAFSEGGDIDYPYVITTGAVWDIQPLPAGAIIDVASNENLEDNWTYTVTDNGINTYYASTVSMSDTMGYLCAHKVEVEHSLTFSRVFTNRGWQGFCAPIDLKKEDWESYGSLWELDQLLQTDDNKMVLKLKEAETFVPGKPYLFNVTNSDTFSINRTPTETNKYYCYPSDTTSTATAELNGVKCELSCVYDFTQLPKSDKNDSVKVYALSEGVFKRPKENAQALKPYRVMLTITTTGPVEHPTQVIVQTGDDPTTAIDVIDASSDSNQWYDLSGRPADSDARGLLISPSGKKVIK